MLARTLEFGLVVDCGLEILETFGSVACSSDWVVASTIFPVPYLSQICAVNGSRQWRLSSEYLFTKTWSPEHWVTSFWAATNGRAGARPIDRINGASKSEIA